MKKLLTVIAALMAMWGASANASLLSISGGSGIVTPPSNNVLGTGQNLWDNATLSTTAADTILTFYFWGSESGFDNTLNVNFPPLKTHTETDNATTGTPFIPFPGFGSPLFSGTLASAGAVPMSFTGPYGSVGNGTGNADRSIAFAYINEAGTVVEGPTNIALFALDDSGGNVDDNHDDYVGYVVASPVPVPAALPLFLSALGGLGIFARRKQTV